MGITRDVIEKLAVSMGLNHSQNRAVGADLDETSLALIVMYRFAPEKVIAEVGIWRIRSEDAGFDSNRTMLTAGLSVYF